jgi:hypothetical protein
VAAVAMQSTHRVDEVRTLEALYGRRMVHRDECISFGPALWCGLSGSLQELAGVVRVPGADHNVVGPHGPQAVTCPLVPPGESTSPRS